MPSSMVHSFITMLQPRYDGSVDNFRWEQTVVSILFSLIFLGLAPLRIWNLRSKPKIVIERGFQITKLSVIGLYSCVQFILLVVWCLISQERMPVIIVAATLSFLATLVMGPLSYFEHSKSLQPSDLLGLYLFFSFVLDAIHARTLWLLQTASPIPQLFTAAIVIKAGMVLLESKEKTASIHIDDAKRSPEETSSIFNRALFYWSNSLIVTGYRKILSQVDLYSLGEELSAETLNRKIGIAWGNEKFKKGDPSMFSAIIRSFKWPLLAPIVPRLCLIGLNFCQPLFINSLLSYLQDPAYTQTKYVPYEYVGAYAAIYIGLAVGNGFYWHSIFRSLTMVRGALVSAIYKKATEVSIASLDTSAVVTLMSTDITNIEDGLSTVHELWANFVQVCIATVFLGRELGATCVIPITVAVLCAAGSMWLSSKAGPLQTAWVEKTEKRVGVVATMLTSMKGVKMLGLTQKLQDLMQVLRVAEVRSGQRMRLLANCNAAFAFTPILISPVLTFGAFVFSASANNRTLDTTRMFTSISLLWLLSQPLFVLFQMFPEVPAALACLSRIEAYLNAEARVDKRLVGIMTTNHIARPPNENHANDRIQDLAHAKGEYKDSPAMAIRRGAFGWVKGQDILHDINLVFPRSQLTMIIGPVACGKSTLCKALLGETVGFRGDVNIFEHSSEIAFCDQTSFLINDSLRKNILGFSDFDSDWYNAVIDAVNLRDDILTFSQRDHTLIGTNGVSLSGGQKQRVAIARAVYARKRISIFDDVLSGLDRATEQHVFKNVFGREGLLRSLGTTVVLATHAVKFLPSADKIVVLGSNGTVTEEGAFEDLDMNDGYVRSLSIHRSFDAETPTIQPSDDLPASTLEPKQQSLATDELVDESRQSGDASVYMYYFKAIGIPSAVWWLISGAGFGALWTFPTLWLKWWSDANTLHPDQNNTMYLAVYAVLQLLALAFLQLFHGYASTIVAFKVGTKMHWIILKTVMAAPLAYFVKTDIGVTTNRFSQDMELIDGELPLTLNNLGVSVFISIGQLVLIAIASPYIALIFPVLVVVFMFVQEFYLRTSRQLRLMDLEAKSPLYSHFLETLSGLATIRAFGWSEANCELNIKLLDSSQQPAYLLIIIQRWLNLVLDLLATVLGVVVVFLAVRFQASSGFTGVALINVMSLNTMLKEIIMKWTTIETSIGAISRVKSFSEMTTSENLPHETQVPPKDWPQNGIIEIHNISASYSDGGALALRNLTLSIPAGSKVGICGRSGSGKSSLILSLFRMLNLQAGSITIDGSDITTLQRGELRSRLNAIPQDPYFLSGTIGLNLDPYETASDKAMVTALKKVQLWETVQANGGLAGEMSATMLSHGQRQLFCLARAILRPGKIVVLDEATSSVDHKTDEMMQRLIREEFHDRTVIVIAHRLDTILDFDRIALLRNGELVEYDSPGNLLGRPSEFRELYEIDSARRKEGSGEDLVEL